ncbi:hypothetical protein KRR38_08525 [Novosphingobium sp. G106]|uniref:asparagine synthase-related protein n=1 Tax=Novosphingobium sp. G106 TaxID=2849500 RepID=UPI001C2D830D|nr:asparagine synthase-related protein [Novosphingobium sp. G106]MBV1687718.1 hypothetical protein [Novosphingobium sp. G106]
MSGFALLASTGPSEEDAGGLDRALARARGLGMVEIARNAVCVLLVEPGCSYARRACGEGEAFFFGDAFERKDAVPTRLSGIASLLGGLWGDFCSIALRTWPEPQVEIAPALFGTARVFVFEPASNERLYASSLDIGLALAEEKPAIDVEELGAFLTRSTFPRRRSCLSGIAQILPGTFDTCSLQGQRTTTWWNPWSFTPQRSGQVARGEPEALRRVIMDCVAQTARGSHPLLELSGGFDSSVLAHCLAEAGTDFEAVTLVSSAADGDERLYARIAAEAAGACLAEIAMRVEDIDVARPPAVRTVQPGPHILAQHMDSLVEAVAADLGCDSFISGGGGDNVFFATFSVVPIVDLWRCRRSPAAAWRAVRDVAAITGAGQIEVASRAIYRSWWRDRAPRWEPEIDFLARALRNVQDIEHPWLADVDMTRPGTARHVRSLIGILPCLEGYARGRQGRLKFPLLSGPIVEHCLGMPTWEWIGGGRDRAYSRRAFGGFMPSALLARRQKGALDGMFAQLFSAYRTAIRDHLLGGYLAAQGLVDAQAIEHYFAAQVILTDKQYYRLIELAGYETWCRAWA